MHAWMICAITLYVLGGVQALCFQRWYATGGFKIAPLVWPVWALGTIFEAAGFGFVLYLLLLKLADAICGKKQ